MPTFIKTGYWDKLSRAPKEYLNLDLLISQLADGGGGPTTYPIGIAVSDEVSLLNIGLKYTFRIPTDYTVSTIKASLVEAPVGSPLTIDVKKNGTSIFSTLLTIDAGETTSTTAAIPAVILTSNFLSDDVITVHITLIGSTSAGRGLKLWFL